MKLLTLILSALGCGKADRYQVESAVLSSIYDDRAFFATLCGFTLDPTQSPRVEVIDAEGKAQPWFGIFGGKAVPGTATIRLTNVLKQGENAPRTCEAKIGFLWSEDKQAVVEHRGKHIRPTSEFRAKAFRKLPP